MQLITLFDTDKDLCTAWSEEFDLYPEVRIENCSFENLKCERVVTAGNSFGWMTGGIDLAVRDYYGVQVQDEIQRVIIGNCNGELPVGQSIEIQTPDKKKPILIYAPTMRYPQEIDEIDVFYIFVKLLQKYDNFACCGLGTGSGGISKEGCAKQMRLAYEYVLKGRDVL